MNAILMNNRDSTSDYEWWYFIVTFSCPSFSLFEVLFLLKDSKRRVEICDVFSCFL